MYPAVRSLCDSWASCYFDVCVLICVSFYICLPNYNEISGGHIWRGLVQRRCSAGPVLPLWLWHTLHIFWQLWRAAVAAAAAADDDDDACVERVNRWAHLYHAQGAQQWRCRHRRTCGQWLLADGILDRYVSLLTYCNRSSIIETNVSLLQFL